MNFQLGWYAHAIFVDGQYPPVSLAGGVGGNHVVVFQGDEGEDRCEERGTRLPRVETAFLHRGGIGHDFRQQRLPWHELLYCSGNLYALLSSC